MSVQSRDEWLRGYEAGRHEGRVERDAELVEQRKAYEVIALLLGEARTTMRPASDVVRISGYDVKVTVESQWPVNGCA